MSWGNIALIHQHAKSVTSQSLLLDLQPEVRMPQLKPEIHLLNIKMDREAFWVTESKLELVLTASSGSGTSRSVITQTSLRSRLRHFCGCQAALQPARPLTISRASHTNEIQMNTATLFAITQPPPQPTDDMKIRAISSSLCHGSFSKIPADYCATTHDSKYWAAIRTEPTDSRCLLSLCICTHFTMAKCPGSYSYSSVKCSFCALLKALHYNNKARSKNSHKS